MVAASPAKVAHGQWSAMVHPKKARLMTNTSIKASSPPAIPPRVSP